SQPWPAAFIYQKRPPLRTLGWSLHTDLGSTLTALLDSLTVRSLQFVAPMIDAVMRALGMGLAMGWEILWPLTLGFALSGVVQAAVSHQQMSQLLPDDRPRSIWTALALGAASSSCSYAAVALARSIFRKGAHFTAAMAFEMASTNLVLELTIIMVA